jgi:Family of unknown function (DUF5317)
VPALVGALLSCLIAVLRGGSLLALGTLRLRWLPLPLFAFGLQFAAFGPAGELVGGPAVLWQLGTSALVLAFLLVNLRYRSLAVVALGTALNLLAITLNGGYMPARPAEVRAIGFPQVAERLERDGHFQKTGRLDESTRLPLLGDVFRLPLPGPDRLVSAGDVLVATGIFLFIQEALVPRRRGPIRRGRRISGWTAAPAIPTRPPCGRGTGPAPPTSTSRSAVPSASTAPSTPTPAKSA